jgi:DMSO/TMAO reductase YedYZ molybdopterin-dependent catalytic subunit
MMHPLPPGQRAVQGFPRFGVNIRRPPPAGPPGIAIEVTGTFLRTIELDAVALEGVRRLEITADLHCVAGWSAVQLLWEGWVFRDVFDVRIAPALPEGFVVAFVVFVGADGYRSIVAFEDAVAPNVLLADRLNGDPLSPAHGAPVRLLSPDQYGFVSTKHLFRIELHTSEPPPFFHPTPSIQRALRTVRPHPRARVWREERHRYLPSWLIRPVYRRLVALPAPLLEAHGEHSPSS